MVTQVKPLVRPDIQLPKLEKSELDMTSDEKAQYTYQDSKLEADLNTPSEVGPQIKETYHGVG